MSEIYVCRCGASYQSVNHTCNMLRRQLEEARAERDYLSRGIRVRDTMIKSLQDECVRLHLQIPIKPFKEQLKEQG